MLRFGTDGVRAEALTQLTLDFARALGFAAARVLGGTEIVIGRDPRESGLELQLAFAQGCAARGVRVLDLGVAPTPAVAWVSQADDIPGAMISASHNPWTDNGIKLFSVGGRKLSDADQHMIEVEIEDAHGAGYPLEVVEPTISSGSIDRYIEAVVASIEGRDFAGSTVVLDSANGSASTTAKVIFETLGATVLSAADQPDGRNINDGVGSTHPEFLQGIMREHGADAGFAFDGDADRIIAVGRDGALIDGDRIIAMTALDRSWGTNLS